MPGADNGARRTSEKGSGTPSRPGSRSSSREHADGELIADRYQLQTRLGRGGMGEVWSGRDLRLHRDVAVKLFHGGAGMSATDLPDWLRREGIAAAQIVHPNVAVLYDQGVHRDRIYLVLELVPGATLGELMRVGRLPLRDALSFAAQIAEALAAAHAARVVHRDIKPQNVLVTPDGTAKVVDFGIAGFLADTRSWTIARFDTVKGSGTPEYAAPEQVMGHNADARSDLYSLGTLLYAMIAGQVPFRADDFLAVMHKKAHEDAPPLPPGAGAPREVVDLVAELLAREPDRRPASARQVAARLRALLERSGRGEAQGEVEGGDSLDRKSRVDDPEPDVRTIVETGPASEEPWTAPPLEKAEPQEGAEKPKPAKLKAQVAPVAETGDEDEQSEPVRVKRGADAQRSAPVSADAGAASQAVGESRPDSANSDDQPIAATGDGRPKSTSGENRSETASGDSRPKPAGAERGPSSPSGEGRSERDQKPEPRAKAAPSGGESQKPSPGAKPAGSAAPKPRSAPSGPGKTPAKKSAPAKSPAPKPPVWGASKEHVTPPETGAWEPLAATGATVLSAAAAMEIRGRSLLPPPARSLLANPTGERYVPTPPPAPPQPEPTAPPRRSFLPVLLIVLAVAAVAVGVIVLTNH
ncbi:serine/threonine-protein kinase [Catenulispora subtropica]|uniref:non-specific serine/threonine protein kinase n=1 Tax=Catenulispora subtropica TaxID=450798 RepID=A0ABP5ERW4_9ACTN